MSNITESTETPERITTPYLRPFTNESATVSAVFILLMMIFGIVANLLTIFVIGRSKKLWTIFNVLIFSLCFSDLLSALVSPLFLYRRTWGFDEWTIHGSFCKLFWAIDTWTNYVTALHILVFAMTRLLSISWPLRYKKLKKYQIGILAGGIWFVTFWVACIPRWMWYEASNKDRHAHTIDAKWPACTLNTAWIEQYRIYFKIAFPIFIYIPMALIAILSPTIAVILIRQRRRRELLKARASPKSRNTLSKFEVKTRRREKHAILQLGFITGSFMLGYIPITVYTFYTTSVAISSQEGKMADWSFGMAAYILLRLSECLNPIFYNVASAKMRRETIGYLKSLFKSCTPSKSVLRSRASSASSNSDNTSYGKQSVDLEL